MVKDCKASLETNQSKKNKKTEINKLHTIIDEALKNFNNIKPKQQNKK